MTLQEAIKHRENGNYAEAETLLAELLRKNPTDAVINYQFAWLCDVQGKEQEAVPYYVAAIENGLSGDALRGALLGLGSTYRTLGEYEKSVIILERGMKQFPHANEFRVFLSMALYNVGECKQAMSMLLDLLLKVTDNEDIQRFKRPIALYAEDLDKVWLD